MEHSYYIAALVIVVFSLLYYHLTRSYGYWKKKLIPCLEGALPGLGNVYPMLFMKRNMADMFRDFYNQMPEHSMIGFYNLREPSLLIREPELAKTVLSTNFRNFATNILKVDPELDPLLAVSPFFSDGDHWKASRQQLATSFTTGKLRYMFTSVIEACNDLKQYLNELMKRSNGKTELELKDLFSRYTAEVVASAAFGIKGESFESEKDGPFREIGRLMTEPSFIKGFLQLVSYFLPFIGKTFKLAILPAKADRFFRKVVSDVLKQREEQGIDRADFLQLMIQYKNANKGDQALNQEFNENIITSRATTFFDDGYETSSITLSFLAYQLAVHPEIQDRIRKEVTNVVAKHGGLTYDAIQEMTYMDQALDESMRLFPALGAFIKVCTKKIELVGSDGITCQVTPGTPVVIPVSALQRDPKYWPNPEKFDPERFSEENKNSRHRFVYLPFGDGPRSCIGRRMAMLQMKAAIATVIQSYTWEVSPRTKEPIQLDPNYLLTAAVGGLWVIVKSL